MFTTVTQGSIDFPESDAGPRKRAYRSELRRRQAEETRLRIVATAAQLFADLGYARTTLSKIAASAGVSPETVQVHGPKAALMIAAAEYAAFGVTGDRSVLDMELGRRFVAITDRDEAIDFLVVEQTSVHERSARVALALVGAAASDPELDGYLDELVAGVGRQVRRLLQVCLERGWLREDLPFDELVETAAIISSFESYIRMVHRDRWSVEAYRSWLGRMLRENVLRR